MNGDAFISCITDSIKFDWPIYDHLEIGLRHRNKQPHLYILQIFIRIQHKASVDLKMFGFFIIDLF